MAPKALLQACFVLSTVYTVILLIIFIVRKDVFIPLTYRTQISRFGDLQQLMRDYPFALPVPKLNDILLGWCDTTSPQCSCIAEYQFTFLNNSITYKTDPALGDIQAKGVLACVSKRSTWHKSTSHFCKIHLALPMLVASLCMSLLFSNAFTFKLRYIPILLSVLVIIMNFVDDVVGAIPITLTILSVLWEISSQCDWAVYWSFQRFFMGSIAVWAAVTHQNRDLYVVSSYATLGFFIGMLAYTEFIMRCMQDNEKMRVVSIYVWVGICAISACLFLLVQQHWYLDSPVWSSLVSVACLLATCLQCVAMAPGVWIPDTLNVSIGLFLLSISVLTVTMDILKI